jgi:hypothetical protein
MMNLFGNLLSNGYENDVLLVLMLAAASADFIVGYMLKNKVAQSKYSNKKLGKLNQIRSKTKRLLLSLQYSLLLEWKS